MTRIYRSNAGELLLEGISRRAGANAARTFNLDIQVWTSSDQRIELYAQTRQ